QLMGFDRDKNIKIASRPAADAGFTLTAQPDARAVLDTLGHIDRKGARGLAPSLTVTIGTGLVHGLATPMTLRAGLLNGEETLAGTHLAVAVAQPAGGEPGPGLGAGAFAGVAMDKGGHVDIDRGAGKGVFEADFEIVAQVGTALAAVALTLAAPSTHEVAEHVLENIGHRRGKVRSEPLGSARAIGESRVAEPVIGGAFLGVLEGIVGLGHFLELVLGILVPRIAIRME